MPKLCQLIAVVSGKKSSAQSETTKVHHLLQKADVLSGLSKTYRPKDEEGDRLPSESKNVQYTAWDGIAEASDSWASLFDAVAAQDATNCVATADVVVDGAVILKNVPVTHLLFLEKQLVDLHTFVSKLPTLDPANEWTFDESANCYRSQDRETVRTKKVPKSFVAYEATKEHPAQVQVFNEDVLVGYWTTTEFSGAIPEKKRRELLSRVRELQDAVKYAREQANQIEVVAFASSAIIGHIFGRYREHFAK